MTDRDSDNPRSGARRTSALDQLAKLRQGLREGGGAPTRRAPPEDAPRRARETFGDGNGGRVAPPSFGGVRATPGVEPRGSSQGGASHRDVTRLGDADQGEEGSLVRSMLRDMGPGGETRRSQKRGDRGAGYDDQPYDDDGYHAEEEAPYGADDGYGEGDPYRDDGYGEDDYAAEDEEYRDDADDGRFGVYDDPRLGDEPGGVDARGDDIEPWPAQRRAGRRSPMDDARFGAARGGEADMTAAGAAAAGAPRRAPAPDDDFDDDFDAPPRRGDRFEDGGDDDGYSAPTRKRRTSPAQPLNATPPPSGRPPAPFGSVERTLAGRYLRARRKEGFISVIASLSLLGVTLSVAVLIVVMSVMNGFRGVVVNNVIGLEGHVIVLPEQGRFDDYAATAQRVADIPGVTRATPVIESGVFALGPNGGDAWGLLLGVRGDDFLSIPEMSTSPIMGLPTDFGDGRGVAIGKNLAQRLNVAVGERITIIAPNVEGPTTPFGRTPRQRKYEVKYIYETGSYRFDNNYIVVPLDEAQALLKMPDIAHGLQVRVATPDRLNAYVADIEEATGGGYRTIEWRDRQEFADWINALDIERTTMFFILSLLIMIASLVIISGLIMLVKEKGTDIAILRTMGLTRGGVLRVFFMCGAFIGVVGTLIGVALGILLALNVNAVKDFIESFGVQVWTANVYGLSELPSQLKFSDVIFTVSISLGVSFLATLYPARRAARLDPVEALRYE